MLSQVLVALTLEVDMEFERRIREAGHPGSALSLVVWSNLLRFLADGSVPVRQLTALALAPEAQVRFELGCLERWGFVTLRAESGDDRPIRTRIHTRAGRVLRDGWGSARGIRSNWLVDLTAKGRKAIAIWCSLPGEIEERWQARFGNDRIAGLRSSLNEVLGLIDLQLPFGLPPYWDGELEYPVRSSRPDEQPPLSVLLSQLLVVFTMEFNRESRVPLILCANTLRVLGEQPIAEADLPRLTGVSPEMCGIGWRIRPHVTVAPAPSGRGRVVSLTDRGRQIQGAYHELAGAIERRWATRFEKRQILRLIESLRELFVARSGARLSLSEGLIPPAGTLRAGAEAPGLGSREMGAAARRRVRDRVTQTERFVSDPAGSLPHYPAWDMNRGFGP